MTRLLYITDLEYKPGGGGSYAVNAHIQDQLKKHFDLCSPEPIVPKISFWQRLLSRIQRYGLRRASRFFYFSPATLDSNAARAAQYYSSDIDAVCFRSAARWCHATPPVPYFVYLDIVFHTFFENTFAADDFLASDLERIYAAERQFLDKAEAVFFESEWGMQRALSAYSLGPENCHVIGRGGLVTPPSEDTWPEGEFVLVSVALNFEQKGGDLILSAYVKLKQRYPNLRWHIVGGRPTGDWEHVDGITWEGVLDPGKASDLERFRDLLARAFVLLHPTREDTNPLVLTEAAYFGCPCISVRHFAIPELVIDGETGVLVDFPPRSHELEAAVSQLIESPDRYRKMRRAAFDFARTHFEWDVIGARMASMIREHLH
ncbi:glycosyltransferase family 4 protein [Elongatibacter sediminis]|uniref:Glycosyltransferase family 4 protein n=1 Tax=Elongatibacter sediminis TaxID=3119006 RepID=A0AAW9RAJ3_9GAMM